MNGYSLSCLLSLFNLKRAGTREKISLMSLNYSSTMSCITCHDPKSHEESNRSDYNIHFLCFANSLTRAGFNDHQHLDLSI